MIPARDLDYIETRLCAPCVGAGEAYERLVKIGQHNQAHRLMEAMQEFVDKTRDIRHAVVIISKTS